jgi:Na+-driven multidrug efflux pump
MNESKELYSIGLIYSCRLVEEAALPALALVAVMQPINAAAFVGDGVFQGAQDFSYLAASMGLACFVATGVIVSTGGSLSDVWLSLLLLQVGRAVALGARYADLVPWFGGSPLADRKNA